MSRHWGIATGGKAAGELPSRPRSEPGTQLGPNVIPFPSADHHHRFLPDDRSNSRRLEAAEFFTPAGHPFEFGSIVLFCVVVFAPTFFVGAAVLLHAFFVSEPI